MLYRTPILTDQEKAVIERTLEIRGSLKYALSTPARWYGLLRRSTFARAVRGSNSIEGYNVSEEDALAAVEGSEPEEATAETWRAILGYRNAMTYVLQLSSDPHFTYSDGLIKSLHYMMIQDNLTKNPGKWRPGPIFVRDDQKKEIVYEGPEAEKVPALIRELIDNLSTQSDPTPVMVRAAMAHLNLVMIHPFSDGNGRMARCLQTLVLAREGILESEFCSIEEYLGHNTQSYYDVLALVGQGSWHPENDARPWLRYCLTAHFRQASTLLRRTKEMKRLWDLLETMVHERQLPERLILALADAANGYRVRNSTYRSAAQISENLASRDLKILVDEKLLKTTGEKRGRSYVAAEIIRAMRERSREPKISEDPFADDTLYLPGMEPR